MSILYPVAETAEAALHAPRGRAAREKEAADLAGGRVRFDRRLVGPGYRSREAALDAYAGRIEDDRAERRFFPPPDALWCALEPVLVEGGRAPPPVQPAFADGRRWPEPAADSPETVWRLSVAYWRIGKGEEAAADLPPARRARRESAHAALDGRALRALAVQPLRAVKPQQPLDVGLFEVRPPEAPDRLIPDE